MVTDALDILSPDGYIETTYPITMEQARQVSIIHVSMVTDITMEQAR